MLYIELFETIRPEIKTAFRNCITNICSHSGSCVTWTYPFPWEKSQNRSGTTGFISIIKMISTRIVKIYGLLNHAQSQYFCIKIEITLSIVCYSGYVMKTQYSVFHNCILSQ